MQRTARVDRSSPAARAIRARLARRPLLSLDYMIAPELGCESAPLLPARPPARIAPRPYIPRPAKHWSETCNCSIHRRVAGVSRSEGI